MFAMPSGFYTYDRSLLFASAPASCGRFLTALPTLEFQRGRHQAGNRLEWKALKPGTFNILFFLSTSAFWVLAIKQIKLDGL
jgi:hypothetical protein